MSYKKYVTNCRNPHVGMRRNTSARALHSSHRSCFDPFVPPEKLTDNQQLLLEGRHPHPRRNQVTALLRKLKHYGRLEEAERVFEQYKYFYQEVHKGDPSPVEAVSILEGLTPSDLK